MPRARAVVFLSLSLSLLACRKDPPATQAPADAATPVSASSAGPERLPDARRGFTTHLTDKAHKKAPPTPPPPATFTLVHYPSKVGDLAAYVTPRPADGKARAAVVWVQGGFESSIDASSWEAAPAENDQSARAFREAGLVLMIPSFRGGNDNPGSRETLYGEVDDVIAAGDYAARLPYVDPSRVYLAGHSTGGTLALLVAESTDRFRAVFAFGAVGNAKSYADEATFDVTDEKEVRLRSPMFFTSAIRSPTFVLEGASPPSNAGALPYLLPKEAGSPVRTFAVKGVSHFGILAPVTRLVAAKIAADSGAKARIELTDAELAAAVGKP
jgi:acetyl esterase/lipase